MLMARLLRTPAAQQGTLQLHHYNCTLVHKGCCSKQLLGPAPQVKLPQLLQDSEPGAVSNQTKTQGPRQHSKERSTAQHAVPPAPHSCTLSVSSLLATLSSWGSRHSATGLLRLGLAAQRSSSWSWLNICNTATAAHPLHCISRTYGHLFARRPENQHPGHVVCSKPAMILMQWLGKRLSDTYRHASAGAQPLCCCLCPACTSQSRQAGLSQHASEHKGHRAKPSETYRHASAGAQACCCRLCPVPPVWWCCCH